MPHPHLDGCLALQAGQVGTGPGGDWARRRLPGLRLHALERGGGGGGRGPRNLQPCFSGLPRFHRLGPRIAVFSGGDWAPSVLWNWNVLPHLHLFGKTFCLQRALELCFQMSSGYLWGGIMGTPTSRLATGSTSYVDYQRTRAKRQPSFELTRFHAALLGGGGDGKTDHPLPLSEPYLRLPLKALPVR